MPSRKKAQGRARKAKQAAEAKSNLVANGFSYGCYHIDKWNCSRDDYDAAMSLMGEYRHKYYELVRGGGENCLSEIFGLANVTYGKYHQLTDAAKDAFQKLFLADGTEKCVDAAKKKDLTNETTVAGTTMHLILINTIEVRHKYNGAYDLNIDREITASVTDLEDCPRQIIRFFHRRNCCSCLQDIYYKLKETTSKTSICYNCKKVVEIKQLSRCEHCNFSQYCSYDCALAHWPEHKVGCERMGYYKPNRPAKLEDDLEAVD